MENKFKKICVDANTAVGMIGYACSEVACIYPITPSSPMAEVGDEMASAGKKNMFDRVTNIVELQSEAGAAGAVHGSLAAGALTTTFTASQGLLLMIPNMYKIAGEALPSVFHVSARTLAAHALNIFGDHGDVMACRQTGFCMLASNNVQEAHDFALIAHVATLKASLPFLHFFDGFRTSHEINKIDEIPMDIIKQMMPTKELDEFRKRAHNPEHPTQTGTAQNADIFFQNREACNPYYDKTYNIVVKTMNEFAKLTGRKYKPFDYVGAKDATDVIVAMCSGCEAVEAAIEVLNKKYKQKVGLVKVRLYRPFNGEAFAKTLPKTVKNISILDRCKEPGALGEPLYIDVVSALKENNISVNVFGGRYGLGGKDFRTSDVASIVSNMHAKKPIKHFTVSINDDVTHLSLPESEFKMPNPNCYEMLFYGLGSDGTVSANKSSIKICGLNTNKYVQGYFEYDSKKSGSLTTSHLRISDKPIKMPFYVKKADFVAIHKYTFVHDYDLLKTLKPNGKVLLNTNLTQEQLGRDLPENFKKHLKECKAELYVVPADRIAREIGLRNRTNTIMQACFFKIANIIPFELAQQQMKDFAIKAYGK
ncbi:MAG: 2-oxoacid:acceptor oxidoreductase family protein, partial [Malacoplasma sp.]|nr:2-oxoacid:acceptor oxidoreductase family protein [Malacoplasma sp.]